MRVLLTGSTGFVGLNVVAELLAAGHAVRAYVRPRSPAAYLARFPVEVFRGELDDVPRLRRALGGVEAVVHCAGDTSCDRAHRRRVWHTNVEGTRAVVAAAQAENVRRLVYTSTTSTVGAHDDPDRRWDEGTPLQGFRAASPYGSSKREAERIVLGAAGLEAVVLNPAEVIGAWDHTLQWGRMVLAVCHDQVPFVPPGSASFCSAREVGRAHVAALTRGAPGTRYLLAGADAGYARLIDEISRAAGVRPRLPGGSYAVRRAAAALRTALAPLGVRAPLVDPYRMRVFGGHYLFDSARAVRELGYRPAPLAEMIQDCLAWYRQEKMVPPAPGTAHAEELHA
jgi:dihydroflavonol-4-reductase